MRLDPIQMQMFPAGAGNQSRYSGVVPRGGLLDGPARRVAHLDISSAGGEISRRAPWRAGGARTASGGSAGGDGLLRLAGWRRPPAAGGPSAAGPTGPSTSPTGI